MAIDLEVGVPRAAEPEIELALLKNVLLLPWTMALVGSKSSFGLLGVVKPSWRFWW